LSETLSCDAIIEHGLIERYLTGALPESEVEALESHYLTCSRCQTELRMAAAIRDALPEMEQAAADVSPAAATPWWHGRRARIGGVAAAIAAVLAGIVLVPPALRESAQHRDAVPAATRPPAVEAPSGEVGTVDEFRWTAVSSADLYRVTLYDMAGDVISTIETRATHAALPDSVRLEPGGLYLWQVSARVDWDRWLNSELVRFTIPNPD
jgi:hypothetical protein